MNLVSNKISKWESLFCKNSTPITQVADFMGVKLSVKRDDLNHQIVQGNKLRKLKYNFKHVIENNYSTVITFGGAWSNHILATAQATQICGLKCVGFIRGDELHNHPEKWSKTLIKAQESGMELIFLDRHHYRQKHRSKTVGIYFENLKNQPYIVPEGGSNSLALEGIIEIPSELKQQLSKPTHIITACGTGGTLAGLIDGVADIGWNTCVIGIPVLKGAQYLHQEVEQLSKFHDQVNWQMFYNYHAGGYAKIDNKTLSFGLKFFQDTKLKLDKIYNAKSFYATYDLIKRGFIKPGSHVVILHTGGLQGGLIAEP